ncbi:MAG: patatin-like phospholipase family protein [Planctomycetota bacterium]
MSGVVLVLSGGGARAMAHLGVLEVLEQARVPIDRIIGVSAGAVAGALYGRYGSARGAQEELSKFLATCDAVPTMSRIARVQRNRHGLGSWIKRLLGYWRLVRRPGIVEGRHLLRTVQGLVGEITFEELRTPLSIVVTDLITGREVVLGHGPVLPVLAGTCALPGIFEPIRSGEYLLVDSGDVNPLPVNVARRYRPQFTMASDVCRGKMPLPPRLNGVEVQARARDAAALVLRAAHERLADFVFHPRVLRRDWTDFADPEEAYQAGRAAANRKLDRLLAGLQWKEIVSR